MSPLAARQRRSRFLEPLRGRLSAEPEAGGAVRTVGLADHVIVLTTCFRRRLRVQASRPGSGRHRHDFMLKGTLTCTDEIMISPPQKAAILPVLARIVLRRVVRGSAAQNPPACFGVLRLTLRQSLGVLGGTGRGRRFPRRAVVGGTFQDANLRRGGRRQRVVLDDDGGPNR